MAQHMWHYPAASAASSWIPSVYPQDTRSLCVPRDMSGSMRQKPSRVVKPSSAGNSPRRNSRRAMISHTQLPNQAPTRNGRLEDCLYPALLAAASEQRARPISWHPSTAQPPNMVSQTPANASWQEPMCENPPKRTFPDTSSGDASGFVVPMPYSNPEDTMFPSPLDGYRTYPTSSSPSHGYYMDNSKQTIPWPSNPVDSSYYSFPVEQSHHNPSPYSQHSPQSSLVPGMSERGDTTYFSSRSSAASLTPDILPIQRFDDDPPTPPSLPQKPDPLGDELVGMGLYDGPEPPSPYDPEDDFMMKADGTVVPVQRSAGKGLKLEETFVPSNNDGSEGSSSEEPSGDDQDGPNFEPNNDQQQPKENVQVVSDENDGSWAGSVDYDARSLPTLAGSSYFDDVEDNVDSGYIKPMMFSGNMYANNHMSSSGYGWI